APGQGSDPEIIGKPPSTYRLCNRLYPYPGPYSSLRPSPMTLHDIAARAQRLDQLSRGLAKEIVIWKPCNDALLYRERQDYLKAIREALSGIEAARVVLAKARQRLDGPRP